LEKKKIDLIETRIDYLKEKIILTDIKAATDIPLIGTVRSSGQGGVWRGSEKERIHLVLECTKAGFDYIDLELATKNLAKIVEEIKKSKSKVILSYHDFQRTPTNEEMVGIYNTIKSYGGDYCKIVGTANAISDNLAYLNFLSLHLGNIAFGMGKAGILSRILCPLIGGAWTYASLTEEAEVALGQIPYDRLREIYRIMGIAG
jgi:3-dehydroquinate dehydratase type I